MAETDYARMVRDAEEAAALRTRRGVRPPGGVAQAPGRQEGALTEMLAPDAPVGPLDVATTVLGSRFRLPVQVGALAAGGLLSAIDPAQAGVVGRAGKLLGKKAAVDVSPVPRRAITDINLRELPLNEAVKAARTEQHLIPSPTREAYVGAPDWVKRPQDVAKMRANFDAQVERGIEGADWYPRAQAGVKEIGGPDPAKQSQTARELALTSAQSTPETNLGFAINMRNTYEAGAPVKSKTGQMSRTYEKAREAGTDIPLGQKTDIYAGHMDPTRTDPSVGTNDIWHGRAFGYDAKSNSTGFKPQQHAFLDAETLLATDRANQKALGGRTDWTPGEIQAAPWVAGKGEGLQQQFGWTADRAMAEARKTYPDYFRKHTAFGTHEATPGVGTGHLPELAGGTGPEAEAARAAFAADPRSSWRGPADRDEIYNALGMYTRPSRAAQGMFEGPQGLEFNPADVARPLVGFERGAGGSVGVEPSSRALMNVGEGTRAYIDAQNAGAWHIPIFHGKRAGDMTSLSVPMERAMTPQEMMALKQAGAKGGLGDVVDTGQGATITSFYPDPPSVAAMRKSGVERAVLDALPPGAGAPRQAKVESGYQSFQEEFANAPGSGEATRKLRALIENHPDAPKAMAHLDASPAIKERALARLERDAEVASKSGQPLRQDVQNARAIIGKEGFSGLFRALDAGKIALPSTVLVGLQQVLQQELDRGE